MTNPAVLPAGTESGAIAGSGLPFLHDEGKSSFIPGTLGFTGYAAPRDEARGACRSIAGPEVWKAVTAH